MALPTGRQLFGRLTSGLKGVQAPCRYSYSRRQTDLCLSNKILPTNQTCPRHSIHTSAILFKQQKGGKQDAKKNIEKAKGKADAANNDPDDFSVLESHIEKAHTRMKEELTKLRAGGQVSPAALEEIRVTIDKSAKDQPTLGDLATVVPGSGRRILIMVAEKDHVKAVSSAVLASEFSLNPVPSPNNPVELQITLPPPTAESRKQVLQRADEVEQLTLHTIRQARGDQQKKLNAMEKVKTVNPDHLRKARTRMEKVIEAANKDAKEIVKKAKTALER